MKDNNLRQHPKPNPIPHQLMEGTTWHVRYLPVNHVFNYAYRYWGINLTKVAQGDYPDEVFLLPFGCLIKLFSMQNRALYGFNPQDYINLATDLSLDTTNNSQSDNKLWLNKVNYQFQRLTQSLPEADVLALISSRNLGLYFSPVNFYLGFDSAGKVSHLLAEVSNTPWNKRHYYGFKLEDGLSKDSNNRPKSDKNSQQFQFCHPKKFHVSPFNPSNQSYKWKLKVEQNREFLGLKDVTLTIEVSDHRGKVFAAGINMKSQPLNKASIKRSIISNPLMNYSSLARIYLQALNLYLVKKVPYFHYNQNLNNAEEAMKPQQTNPSSKTGNHSASTKTKLSTKNLARIENIAQGLKDKQRSQSLFNSALAPVSKGFNTLCRKLLLTMLSNISSGDITLIETYHKNNRTHHFGFCLSDSVVSGSGSAMSQSITKESTNRTTGVAPLQATVYVHNSDFYRRVLFGGSIAVADSYIDSDWDTDDLTDLLRLVLQNKAVFEAIDSKISQLVKRLEKKKHQKRNNTLANSRSNIEAHYDIGNAVYKLFLDKTLMYSSAIYPTPKSSLLEAQLNKLQILCELLELKSNDKVIEIGTGWGGFAIYAAQNYGCHVTTTTISEAQFEEAQKRVKELGLQHKITLLKQDYRQLRGQYDKLISIEMIEAVGHKYLSTFFAKCKELLKPNGIMVLQAITYKDQDYDDYLDSIDFIQSHIFPGGCLVSNLEIISQFQKNSDMVVKSLIDYGYDYAHTLQDWKAAFNDNLQQIKALGFDDKFIRLWQYYFAYCESGFLEQTIGVVQVKAVKPDYRNTFKK